MIQPWLLERPSGHWPGSGHKPSRAIKEAIGFRRSLSVSRNGPSLIGRAAVALHPVGLWRRRVRHRAQGRERRAGVEELIKLGIPVGDPRFEGSTHLAKGPMSGTAERANEGTAHTHHGRVAIHSLWIIVTHSRVGAHSPSLLLHTLVLLLGRTEALLTAMCVLMSSTAILPTLIAFISTKISTMIAAVLLAASLALALAILAVLLVALVVAVTVAASTPPGAFAAVAGLRAL
jgi:hypothetical protein